jgi:hypothetical protein
VRRNIVNNGQHRRIDRLQPALSKVEESVYRLRY